LIGYWGYLQFEVNDNWIQYPTDIERTVAGRYEKYYPANTEDRPKSVFLGAEVGTVTFTMLLDQRFNSNIRDLLADIARWVNEGYAAELVIGTKVYGHNKWVCTKAVEKFTEVLHNGIITRAEIEMTLEEY
jgi:hypothetical protein